MINTIDENLELNPFSDMEMEIYNDYSPMPEIKSESSDYEIDVFPDIQDPINVDPQSNLQITPQEPESVPEKRNFVPEFGTENSQAQGHRPRDGGKKISNQSSENYRRSLADGIGNSNKLSGASKKQGPRFSSRNLAAGTMNNLPENRKDYF